MNRTVTALYETQTQAEQARDALAAAHLGEHVTIHDRSAAGDHRDFGEWLSGLFGKHEDRHVYGEGLRRGHFLLSAKVDDLNEIRAAEILDAAQPVDLSAAEKAWRGEGWTPAVDAVPSAPTAAEITAEDPENPIPSTEGHGLAPIGVRVRSYVLTEG